MDTPAPWVYKGQQAVNAGAFALTCSSASPGALARPCLVTLCFHLAHHFGTQLRLDARDAHWRGRHADGHCHPELVRRPLSSGMGFVLDNKLLITAGRSMAPAA